MADQLLTGTTLVESSSRSDGDIQVGGIIEFDDTYKNIPDGFLACDGSTVNDPLSVYNGLAVPNLNTNYITIHGGGFNTANNSDGISRETNDIGTAFFAGTIDIQTLIQIPEGATITACKVYGGSTGSTAAWNLYKKVLSDTAIGGNVTSMATAVLGTTDTTITSATIDNILNSYLIHVNGQGNAEVWVTGAKVTYEPRFKFIIRIR